VSDPKTRRSSRDGRMARANGALRPRPVGRLTSAFRPDGLVPSLRTLAAQREGPSWFQGKSVVNSAARWQAADMTWFGELIHRSCVWSIS
jgi:hypothetical protein